MYGQFTIPAAMPLTGAGGLALLSAQSGEAGWLVTASVLLAVWTLVQGALAAARLVPRVER